MTKNTATPFGWKYGNGTDFSRSVTNPNSRLSRIVRYVRSCETPVSKRAILREVCNVSGDRAIGWGTLIFTGMIKTGFLEKVGAGSNVRYIEGRRASLISTKAV